ncbi:hypothetical protein [Microbacterium sp. AG238]|uniref:hypothetical protein n=1 Tax=Microbacterium sp. AG238 TaxID=2183994 RepID=UPI000FF313D2|nr:hypothetical protein [Microbacterium sp. AG238]RKE64918.1 hypothetical protein DEU36_2154 [Microbacterium sp. AG238]
MRASAVTTQHGRTAEMDIHDIVRELNAVLGSTLVAALSGSKDRELPNRWAKPEGPEPRDHFAKRLQFAHRQWALLAAADGDQVVRQWFIGSNPLLNEATPVTAIREDRHDAVARAAAAFITGDIDE